MVGHQWVSERTGNNIDDKHTIGRTAGIEALNTDHMQIIPDDDEI